MIMFIVSCVGIKSACMNQIYIVDIFPMIKKYGCALIASKASNNYFTGG